MIERIIDTCLSRAARLWAQVETCCAILNLPALTWPSPSTSTRRFKDNPQLSDDTAACKVWSETIDVMLLTYAKWRTFTSRPIPLATSSEVMLALSCDSRSAVAAMNKAANARAVERTPTGPGSRLLVQPELGAPDGQEWSDVDGPGCHPF
jgi:uncharacterized protein